jgi:hypothetical protein
MSLVLIALDVRTMLVKDGKDTTIGQKACFLLVLFVAAALSPMFAWAAVLGLWAQVVDEKSVVRSTCPFILKLLFIL